MMNKITHLSLTIKYWLDGDDWDVAWHIAEKIIYWPKADKDKR